MINTQSLKIIIAGAIVMFATNFLTSCAPQAAAPEGVQRIQDAQQYKKTVEMQLVQISGTEDIKLRLIFLNPEERPITSAQTWLAFNPEVLKGVKIDVSESDFSITAPYDNVIDQETGLIMLGRSSAEAISSEKIVMADFSFERIGEGAVLIDAYDYKTDLSGHSSVNMVDGETPYNLLLKPESPLFTIEN